MTIQIDGLEIQSKKDFYKKIGQVLDLPDYFGNNLDALHDVLAEYPKPISFTFFHYETFTASVGIFFNRQLCRMLEDLDILTTIVDEHA